MIISKLQGGLGNQIFQWAYGRSVSSLHGFNFQLDIGSYNHDSRRKYSLDKFPNIFDPILNSPQQGNFQRIMDDFNYRDIDFDSQGKYYLDGYWQSEKYFIKSEDLIKSELSPTESILSKSQNILPKSSINVSIHIRRTDYLESNGYHPIQPIEYYQNGLDLIGLYDNIIVFSDDISWCKSNLKFNNMIFIDGFSDIEDLWLMNLCDHNIIANSSFSWWGAWLNNNPNKKVIAPIKWFGDKTNLNTDDIIPNNWIKI